MANAIPVTKPSAKAEDAKVESPADTSAPVAVDAELELVAKAAEAEGKVVVRMGNAIRIDN